MNINLRKSKVSYTIMVISDSADRDPKTYHIKAGLAGFTGILAFMLFTALICFVVYNSVIASGAVNRVQTQQEKIEQLQGSCEQLKELNEQLEQEYKQEIREKEELAKQVTILSDALNTEKEEAQLLVDAAEQKRIPTKFPLDAAAAMKEETEEQQQGMTPNQEWKEIVFTAAEGTNVIATAPGTVVSVTEDEELGNLISIDHGNGYISTYRNKSNPIVKQSNEVDAGAVLFVIGKDNLEMGYSIRKDDSYIDPLDMLDIKG